MNHKKILIVVSLIMLLTNAAYGAVVQNGDLWKATCTCTCKGNLLSASGVYKSTFGVLDDPVLNVTNRCQDQCARNCGGLTTSSSDDKATCASLCQGDCSGVTTAPCIESCSSTCSYNGVVNDIVTVIYEVAGVVGALMIVFYCIKMLTAQDPGERTSAKRSIIYVIIALIIIILAANLVPLFMNHTTTP